MKKLFGILSAILILLPYSSLTAASLEGTYDIWGTNGENEYEGQLEIIDHGGAYEVNWLFGGEEYYFGVGVQSGEYFAVAYTDESNSDLGAVIYKTEGENFMGYWATISGIRGLENVFRAPLSDSDDDFRYVLRSETANPVGSYNVAGTNADESVYSCVLEIQEYDDIYSISWIFDSFSYDGIAFSDGNLLICAWTDGSLSTVGISLMKKSGDGYDGIWAFYGSEGTGSEVWTKN